MEAVSMTDVSSYMKMKEARRRCVTGSEYLANDFPCSSRISTAQGEVSCSFEILSTQRSSEWKMNFTFEEMQKHETTFQLA